MKITVDLVQKVFGLKDRTRVEKFFPYMSDYAEKYEVNTPLRIAMFLAQVGHESGRLRYVEEIASGAAYEGRKNLGNTKPGDGVKYKGRGLIQITGRANYAEISKDTGIDFISTPENLSAPKYAVLSAFWFWNKRGLNKQADADLFLSVTHKINGGYNGLEDRELLFKNAKKELGI